MELMTMEDHSTETSVDASIIIVGWNTCDLVRQAIKSVFDTAQTTRVEVIYVDNASSDQTVEMVRREFPSVNVIANSENLGFVKGNNQAIAVSQGRYLILLNSDAQLLDYTLDRCISFMEAHPETGIVGCELLNSDGSFQAGYWDFPTFAYQITCLTGKVAQDFKAWKATYSPTPAVREADWISGAYMVVRRQAVEQAGMMDERFFMYSEEVEWCLRIKKAGWKVHYLSDVKVIHHHRGSSIKRTVRPFQAHSIRSQQILFWTHYPKLQAFGLMIISIGVGFGMIAKGLLSLPTDQFSGRVRIRNGIQSILYCFETLTLTRPQIPFLPVASTRESQIDIA